MSTFADFLKEIKKLNVRVGDNEVGLLTHKEHFEYLHTDEHQPVSLTMTDIALTSIRLGRLHPIFSQNLPEGFNLKYIASKMARHVKFNEMYLLALQGDQSIGMLGYDAKLDLPEVEPISLKEILTYNSSKALFPQLLERYYLRNNLAGMQPKVSIENVITDDVERTVEQKDIIVKSYDEEFELLTVNEFVCMEAARYCGLEPPKTYLSANLETFIVERFDHGENGSKLGYEDFTTLLKRKHDPDEKYRGNYETLLKATEVFTQSKVECAKMYKYIVFNCLIGNGDAHLKNFALQYTPDMSNIFVSPPFDITHTLIYEHLDNNMALKMRGSKQFPTIGELIKLDTQDYIANPQKLIEEMAQRILDYLKQSNEVQLFKGLRESIEQSVSRTMIKNPIKSAYVHDKRRKYK